MLIVKSNHHSKHENNFYTTLRNENCTMEIVHFFWPRELVSALFRKHTGRMPNCLFCFSIYPAEYLLSITNKSCKMKKKIYEKYGQFRILFCGFEVSKWIWNCCKLS